MQLDIKRRIDNLRIELSANVDTIEAALRTIETDWPKVKVLEQTALAAIKHALQMFDLAHPYSAYILALQAQLDIGAKVWPSFGAFRTPLVEHFRVGEARNATRQLHSGMAAYQRQDGDHKFQGGGKQPGGGRSARNT